MEFAHGREPDAKKFAPRTLDLDLLLYGELVCETPLVLPRGEILTNAFVLSAAGGAGSHIPPPHRWSHHR